VAAERLAPPVRESNDLEYAANLRRATLASSAESARESFDLALCCLASASIVNRLVFQTVEVTR